MRRITLLILGIVFGINLNAQTYVNMVKTPKGWSYITLQNQAIGEVTAKKCVPFSEHGVAAFMQGKKWMILKADGSVIEPEIQGFTPISNGAFAALQGFSDGLLAIRQGKRYGYLNTEGKIAIEIKYSDATIFQHGYAVVKNGKDFYVLNTRGEETHVDVNGATKINRFTEGLAPYVNDANMHGFINHKGQEVIKPKFRSVGFFFGGLAWARDVNGLIGYINIKGEWVIEPEFEAAKAFDKTSGMARVKKNGQWFYIDRQGKVLEVTTELYGNFSEGLAKGKKNGLVGFFDNTGNWIIQPEFENVRDFHNGYAAARKNGKWGIIDKSGKWIIEPQYLGIRDVVAIY